MNHTLAISSRGTVSTREAVAVNSDLLLRYIVLGALVGLCGAIVFKIVPYDLFIGKRSFYDMGPSLLNGRQPDMLQYSYVVLVVLASAAAAGFLWWRCRNDSGALAVSYPNVTPYTYATVLGFAALMQIVVSSLAGVGWTPFMTSAIGWSVIALGGLVAFHYKRTKVLSVATSLEPTARIVIIAAFAAMCVAHAGKLITLGAIFLQTGMRQQAWIVFILFIGIAFIIGWLCTPKKTFTSRVRGALLGGTVYIISIREASILWGVDTFHEGETFLTGTFLLGGAYEFLSQFIPIHGLGRNVLPSYISALFSNDNLYFSRTVRALYFPLVDVLIVGFLVKYSGSVIVALCFFVLNYLFGFLFDWDISPFFLVALLLVSTIRGQIHCAGMAFAAGLALFMESIYSYEFFLFIHISLVATLGFGSYQYSGRSFPPSLRWLYAGFYGATVVFFISLWNRSSIWFDVLRNAIGKSPNLLQRELEIPTGFSPEFFLLVSFVSLFVVFHLVNIVGFLPYIRRAKLNPKRVVIVACSMVSLMYLVRAFNRSDMGHVLMALYISAPVILGLLLHYRFVRRDLVVIGTCLAITVKLSSLLWHGQLSLDVFKQAAFLDARLATNTVPSLAELGSLKIPAGTASRDLVTPEELGILVGLKNAGFKLYDMSNQPLLVYGIVGAPLVDRDMHSIFYNTFNEQLEVIQRLERARDSLVIWSSRHWTETLDGTYSELRLPILADYILKLYSYTYQFGRFTVLSRSELEGWREERIESDSLLRRHYDLGFAPGRMSHYGGERVMLIKDVGAMNMVDIKGSKPDAVRIEVLAHSETKVVIAVFKEDRELVAISFRVHPGTTHHFVRLNSLPAVVRDDPTTFRYEIEGDTAVVMKTELLKLDPVFTLN